MRILSMKRAKAPRHGVRVYAVVQSESRPTRVNHVVTGMRVQRKLRFRCSCEAASFNPRGRCNHAKAVARRLHHLTRSR